MQGLEFRIRGLEFRVRVWDLGLGLRGRQYPDPTRM